MESKKNKNKNWGGGLFGEVGVDLSGLLKCSIASSYGIGFLCFMTSTNSNSKLIDKTVSNMNNDISLNKIKPWSHMRDRTSSRMEEALFATVIAGQPSLLEICSNTIFFLKDMWEKESIQDGFMMRCFSSKTFHLETQSLQTKTCLPMVSAY